MDDNLDICISELAMKVDDITKRLVLRKQTTFSEPMPSSVENVKETIDTDICEDRKIRPEIKKTFNDNDTSNDAPNTPSNFTCDQSGKCFPTKNLLKKHEIEENVMDQTKNTNIQERPSLKDFFYCDNCEFKTNVKRYIELHLKLHAAKKVYTCNDCGYKCINKENLRKHIRTHTGDGPLIPVDAEVTLHYAAYWEKAKIPFDSTLTMNSGVPLKIRLGTGSVLLGLEIGLTAIKGPKARFHLLLQPKVAWGEKGAPPRVRPEPALFVIILYDVRDTQAGNRFNDLPMEEQKKFEVTMRTVKSLHAQAKVYFNKRKYKKAIQNYQQSLSVLRISQPMDKTEESEVEKLKIVAFVNLAVCYYKIEKPKYVINMCENIDEIIDIETHCKALFYYGRAHEMLGKREEALKYYNKALKLEPKNKDIGKALVDFERYVQESSKKEKEMWQNAFEATPQKKTNVVYDVDEEFQNGVREMCQSLAENEGCAQFDLPTGLTRNELDFLKSLVTEFDGLIVDEEGEGKRKRVTVVKQA